MDTWEKSWIIRLKVVVKTREREIASERIEETSSRSIEFRMHIKRERESGRGGQRG